MSAIILPEDKNKLLEINFNAYSHIKVPNNRLMAKIIPIDFSKSEGGVLTSSKDGGDNKGPVYAVIVSIGEGVLTNEGKFLKPNYELGDVVAFSHGSGADFKLFRGPVGSNRFESIRVVDLPSIHFVDNSLKPDSIHPVYKDVTEGVKQNK